MIIHSLKLIRTDCHRPRMKLHQLLQNCSFFLIKLAAFQASGAAHMKLRIVGTVNRLNIEHRTSNIERPILRRYALSILRQANRRISNVEGWNRFRLRLRLRPDRSLSLF